MNKIFLNSGKYLYEVTYQIKPVLPKTSFNGFNGVGRITPRLRTTKRYYIDHCDEIIKEITYPKDLWYSKVVEDDPVEEYIHGIMQYIPDWVKIDIKNKEDN